MKASARRSFGPGTNVSCASSVTVAPRPRAAGSAMAISCHGPATVAGRPSTPSTATRIVAGGAASSRPERTRSRSSRGARRSSCAICSRTRPPAHANAAPSGVCSVGWSPRDVNHPGDRAYQSPPFSTLRTIAAGRLRTPSISAIAPTSAATTTGHSARRTTRDVSSVELAGDVIDTSRVHLSVHPYTS